MLPQSGLISSKKAVWTYLLCVALFSGFALYAPATFVIKGLVALVAWLLYRKGNIVRTLIAFIAAEAVMVAGYFAFEWFVAREYAVVDILGNSIQGISGAALGIAFTYAVPQLERALK